jgi:hypothetical protein
MHAPPLVVLVALVALALVTTALAREVLVLRVRREMDRYLQWLTEHATGPLTVAPLRRYR